MDPTSIIAIAYNSILIQAGVSQCGTRLDMSITAMVLIQEGVPQSGTKAVVGIILNQDGVSQCGTRPDMSITAMIHQRSEWKSIHNSLTSRTVHRNFFWSGAFQATSVGDRK